MTRRALVLIAAWAGACSERASRPSIEVRDAWARPADSAATTAAYFVVVNNEAAAATLTSVSSPVAESAGLHETMQVAGTMHMMAIDAPLAIAPGHSLVLEPGAKHLMVSGLTRRLAAGDSLPLVLQFTGGRVVRAVAVVRAR